MSTAVDFDPTDPDPEFGVESGLPVGKLAAQVARQLEETVIRRGWPVGELLGSEVGLRERFGVSRAVMREAVRLVEHHQVARMRRGPNGGLFVCAPDAGPATRAIVIYLEYVGTGVDDLLEARLLLEPLAARLAADRISEDGITTLRAHLDAEATLLAEPAILDDPLHTLLGQMSGNPALHLFIDVLTRLTGRYAHTSRRISRTEMLTAKHASHRDHRAVVESVIAGEGARAETLLGKHLAEVSDWIDKHRVRRGTRIAGAVIEPEIVEGPRAKLAEVVAARIHDDIAARGWQLGMVLGSEADLLSRYEISRAVLREAIRILEYHSVARMRRGPGGGLIVCSPEPQASIDTMALFLEYQGVSADDLRLVRNAIELGVVARVTERCAAQETDTADRLTAAVHWPVEGPTGNPRKADLFHTELAAAAGNPVLSLFGSIITELFRRHAAAHDRTLPGDRAAEEVRQVHQHILDAIRAGDAGLARHRMRRHLDALSHWWH